MSPLVSGMTQPFLPFTSWVVRTGELALAAVARGETSTDIHEHTAAGLLRDALLPL